MLLHEGIDLLVQAGTALGHSHSRGVELRPATTNSIRNLPYKQLKSLLFAQLPQSPMAIKYSRCQFQRLPRQYQLTLANLDRMASWYVLPCC